VVFEKASLYPPSIIARTRFCRRYKEVEISEGSIPGAALTPKDRMLAEYPENRKKKNAAPAK